MKFFTILSAIVLQLSATTMVFAEPLVVKSGDTILSILEGSRDKQITVRLGCGDELTGKVKFISRQMLQLEALSGREYFDAFIEVSRIEAVILRAKE